MKKIRIPAVGRNASVKAFTIAKNLYNEDIKRRFRETPEAFKGKRAKGMQIRQNHYAVFIQLLNRYTERLERIPPELAAMYPDKMLGLWVTTGELAARLDVSLKTIYSILRRLQTAGIIRIIFHGHKKPLEIRFDPDILLVWDVEEPERLPQSKHLKLSFSDAPPLIRKFLRHKTDTLKQFNNSTIPKAAFACNPQFYGSQAESENSEYFGFHPAEGFPEEFVTSGDDFSELMPVEPEKARKDPDTRSARLVFSETNNQDAPEETQKSNTYPETNRSETEKRKKVPAKKEKSESGLYGAVRRGAKNARKREEKRGKQEQTGLKPIDERRKQVRNQYAQVFTAYLLEKLFADKHLSPEYRQRTVDYVSEHYFAKLNTMQQFENRWANNLKTRIDIAVSWIAKFKTKDGKPFDRTYFFPMAFLNVERQGKGKLSFTNTQKFLEKHREYMRLNNYNRNLDKELTHKLNIISRKVENGFLDYQAALEKVRSLSSDTNEYIKQFNARHAGIYSV